MDFHFLIIENNTTMSQKKDLYVETKNKLRKGKKIHISCEETLWPDYVWERGVLYDYERWGRGV